MPRAKKTDNVEKMDNEKTLMEIDNINPKKTKSKKIKDAIDDSKLAKDKPTDKPKDKPKDKPTNKPKEQKDMSEKELKKELKNKDKEIDRIKKLVLKMNEVIE
jgi:DNA-directed RNA polymerase III subunit RPC5